MISKKACNKDPKILLDRVLNDVCKTYNTTNGKTWYIIEHDICHIIHIEGNKEHIKDTLNFISKILHIDKIQFCVFRKNGAKFFARFLKDTKLIGTIHEGII